MPETEITKERRRPAQYNAVREARSLANEVTLKQLTSLVKHDPASDIADFLKREATSYPLLVEELTASLGSTDPIVEPALNQTMRRGEILFELHQTFVIALGPEHAVKVTFDLDSDHVDNTEYLTTHLPDLPIPRCLGTINCGKRTYMFMSRAPGTTLESVWPELSKSQKMSIQTQLNDIFRLLRAQSYPALKADIRLGSFKSGICKDTRRVRRFSSKTLRTEAEFNDFLFCAPNRTVRPWIRDIRACMKEDHRMVMTHGDLHPRNIMVTMETNESLGIGETQEKVVMVSSIIDWETAGWYPESWEYVKAVSMADLRGPLRDWKNFLPTDAIGSYITEYSLDSLLDQWLR
ncbi:hypothetical protein BDU57DRAFT_587570 [Ampelomyces quisqualis]|uniref:Aminoglycoside phosphotransferase domain-containing protein n=1 Tax=Ampelomyces quisqualis TaxID=50730 RepID=A0A6A5QMF0_AMPQU|nr:hypothetical protein BDU57DRAFT_587570 [Ampelomyces quisqualis]